MTTDATFFTASQVYLDGAFEEGRYLEVRDGEIVGTASASPAGAVVDFGHAAIFPGAVNTHTHSHLGLLRGSVNELDLAGWLERVYGAVSKFGPEEAYLSAVLTFGESLLTGTTTTADFFYLNGYGNERIAAVVDAADELGIRLVMGRTFLDAEWGGEATRETVDVAVDRYRELGRTYAGRPRLQLAPAPHSPYGASREMIEAASQLAREFGSQWYMHLAESESSAAGIEGVRALELLDRWGVLDDTLVAVHAVWLTEPELDLLGERAGRLSYNPASNLFFGERVIDYPGWKRRGITVGLGTDSSASNNGQNMFADLRLAALSQRLRSRNPAEVTNREMLSLLTDDGAAVMRLPVGALATGLRADFIVLDLDDVSLQPLRHLDAHLIYAMSPTAVRHVFVDGRQVVKDRELVHVDMAEIAARINELPADRH
ncbi:MAG TPA: amidohydrolase family protein [Candidatus Limnocylindrales bacterium]|nr:amidohydrolase family protein [Candidatus Limnocylindrales bacterium]